MEVRQLAMLLVPVDDKWTLGTGYMVTADRLLTAWHVVKDATGPIEVRFPNPATVMVEDFSRASPDATARLEDALQIEELRRLDVTLLRLEQPLPARAQPSVSFSDHHGTRWETYAFTRKSYRKNPGRRAHYKAISFSGGFQPAELHSLTMDLTVTSPPDEPEMLPGSSGAAIFGEGGALCGVLVELPKSHEKGQNLITAVRIGALLRIQEFRDAVGTDAEEDRQYVERSKAEAVALLCAQKGVEVCLAKHCSPGSSGPSLVERLVTMPIHDRVRCLFRAQKDLLDSRDRQALVGLLQIVAPLAGLELAEFRRKDVDGEVWQQVPFNTSSMAEFFMAAVDRRGALLELDKGEFSIGKGGVRAEEEHLRAALGTGALGFVAAIRETLRGRLGISSALNPDNMAEAINVTLLEKKELGTEPVLYLMLATAPTQFEDEMRLVRKTFPLLRILVLAPKWSKQDATHETVGHMLRQGGKTK